MTTTHKFIICGVPRAGKSTLARKLSQTIGCSHIPCDPIITAFNNLYPHLGITYSMQCHDQEYFAICRAATRFFIEYIHGLDKEFDAYVVEGFHIDMDMIVEAFGETHTILVVGYPNSALDYKLHTVRKYDSTALHRTYSLDNEFLRRQLDRFIHLSGYYKQKARTLGITFVDTSFSFADTIQGYVDAYKDIPSLFM